MYSLDKFEELAPPEAVVDDEHQLMLNRLSFELAERQRQVITFHVFVIDTTFRLDLKKKALAAQKEELLKESKEKQVTYDNVKSQVDKLMKVQSCLTLLAITNMIK